MEEPHTEGIASHGDPESCVGVREGVGEALTGAHAGWVLSREITFVRGADAVQRCGATRAAPLSRGAGRPRAVRDPMHAWNLPAREPGDP